MANLSKAPAEQLAKAIERRAKAQALLAKHKIGYTRAYSSYNTRKGQVRMKLWDIHRPLTKQVMAELLKLGFGTHDSRAVWTCCTSIVGYF